MSRVKRTLDSLWKIGVDIVDPDAPTLRCRWCRGRWRPSINPNGSLERAWWKCPKGCVNNLKHARNRHREWVSKHAEVEFTHTDFLALSRLLHFEHELDDRYNLLDKLSNLPTTVEERIEPTSSDFDVVSDCVRTAVDAATERGAPFAREFWYEIWRKLRGDRGIIEYVEMARGWESMESEDNDHAVV